MTVSVEAIKGVVADAVNRLLDKDAALLERDVNEQSVAHHLAMYMRESFKGPLSVDVEYNRHGNEKKVLLLGGDEAQGGRYALVRPDVVVHERGTDRNNLLALEVKKFGGDLRHDREKLLALKQQFGYQHAAHVAVGLRNGKPAAEIIWVDAA